MIYHLSTIKYILLIINTLLNINKSPIWSSKMKLLILTHIIMNLSKIVETNTSQVSNLNIKNLVQNDNKLTWLQAIALHLLHERVHESHVATTKYMLILFLRNAAGTRIAIGFILCLQKTIFYLLIAHLSLDKLNEVRAEFNHPTSSYLAWME